MGEKTDQALKEFHEVWDRALKIEQEALELAKREGQKDYDLIREKLNQADKLFKKRDESIKRYLRYLKRGE
jgi:hypothetical protein